MNFFVHKTAIVDAGVSIGSNTKIWHWTHICEGASIGEGCILGQNVFVADNVLIGNYVKIQNNVSVYKGVFLDNDVFCGPSVVFTNVNNPRSTIDRKTEIQKTHVRQGATIGANATVVCGVEIGCYSLIGAGSVVTKDVVPFSMVVGAPARQIAWVSKSGVKLDLPVVGNGVATCSETGQIYKLINDKVIPL